MSYKDPQITENDPMAASVAYSAKKRNEALAASATGESDLSKGLKSIAQGGINLVSKKKESLKQLNQKVLQEEVNLYKKVGGFTTEYEAYNVKSENFFDGLIDKYNMIKGHIDNGTMRDVELGKRDLANIKNLIDQYGKAIPQVLATADIITNASNIAGKDGMGSPGTLSVTGAPAAQLAIIKKISSGGPSGDDIELSHEEGTIILFDKKTGAELNIREFNKASQSKENPYLKLVPDLSKGMENAYNVFTKDNNAEYQDAFTTVDNQDPDNPTATRTMSVDQENKLKKALMGAYKYDFKTGQTSRFHDGGSYKKMINEYGESIWEDMMPTGLIKKGFEKYPEVVPMYGTKEYEAFYDNYYAPMLDYLTTETINRNAVDIQRASQTPDNLKDSKYERGGVEEYELKVDEFLNTKETKLPTQAEYEKALAEAKEGDEVTMPNGIKIRKIKK